MAAADVKPKYSFPELPPLKTPHFSGGKLASIRKKIDEKQLLLAGGIPPQFLRNLDVDPESVPEPTDLYTYIADTLAASNKVADDVGGGEKSIGIPISPSPKGTSLTRRDGDVGETVNGDGNKDKKTSVLCPFCGRNYPQQRIELHQRLCSECAEKMLKIPLIVKLGLRYVDGEKGKAYNMPVKEDFSEEHVKEELNEEEFEDEEDGGGEEEEDDADEKVEEEQNEEKETNEVESSVFEAKIKTLAIGQFPGGGNNWTEEHERYMKYLEEAKQTMEMYASGNFPRLPPPPGPSELEVEYVQCPTCLRRFTENYNASDHVKKCINRRALIYR